MTLETHANHVRPAIGACLVLTPDPRIRLHALQQRGLPNAPAARLRTRLSGRSAPRPLNFLMINGLHLRAARTSRVRMRP